MLHECWRDKFKNIPIDCVKCKSYYHNWGKCSRLRNKYNGGWRSKSKNAMQETEKKKVIKWRTFIKNIKDKGLL